MKKAVSVKVVALGPIKQVQALESLSKSDEQIDTIFAVALDARDEDARSLFFFFDSGPGLTTVVLREKPT